MFQSRSRTATSLSTLLLSRLILIPRPTVQLFSGSTPFNLRVLTPPTIRYPGTDLHRSFHLISTHIQVLDSLAKQASPPAGLHRPSCTSCLATLDLLPRSLSVPAVPLHKPVSAALYPVRSPLFFCPQRC